jgi:hypothetical protein
LKAFSAKELLMPERGSFEIENLEDDDLIRLIRIFLGQVAIHYGMWFTEASRIIGLAGALECEGNIFERHSAGTIKRLLPHLEAYFEGANSGILTSKSRDELLILIREIAKTWVAGDGLWFQAIEEQEGMALAKKVNDSCWSLFARLESYKILGFLGIKGKGGLDTLDKAIRLRIYSSINSHSSEWDREGNLLFQMLECRVQNARRRKGMADYPCKSAGIIEYSEFALGINPDIVTECICCPPEEVPNGQFCAWKFSLKKAGD